MVILIRYSLRQSNLSPKLNTNKGGDIPAALEPGLPDIEGETCHQSGGETDNKGAFYVSTVLGNYFIAAQPGGYKKTAFSAHNSSPIYGNSNTVQPPAIVLIPQIKF